MLVMLNLKTIARTRHSRGFSLIELLIAVLIASVVAVSGFRFYTKMHATTLSQGDVSDLQQLGRSCLAEIGRSLRNAGFKLPAGQPAYEIKGDTLSIYFCGTKPVDTVCYYLEEFSSADYSKVSGLPVGEKLWKLYRRTNSEAPALFADYLSRLSCVVVNPTTIALSVTVHSDGQDELYKTNSGFRTYTLGQTVLLRNSG